MKRNLPVCYVDLFPVNLFALERKVSANPLVNHDPNFNNGIFTEGLTQESTKHGGIRAVLCSHLNNINLQVTVPAMTPSQSYVFARIGVKIAGVEDLIFSPIEKINL